MFSSIGSGTVSALAPVIGGWERHAGGWSPKEGEPQIYNVDVNGNHIPSWRANNLRQSNPSQYSRTFRHQMMPRSSAPYQMQRTINLGKNVSGIQLNLSGDVPYDTYSRITLDGNEIYMNATTFDSFDGFTSRTLGPFAGNTLITQGMGNIDGTFGGSGSFNFLRFTLTIRK